MTRYRRVLGLVILLAVGAVATGGVAVAEESDNNGAESIDLEEIGLDSIETLIENDEELEAHVREYATARAEFYDEVDELNETTDRIDDGGGDLDEAGTTLERLEDRHENMTTQETEIIEYLTETTHGGNGTGTFGAVATINDERTDRSEMLSESTDAYVAAVEGSGDEPRSTVRLTLFGSLLGGLVVGLVAGAAVPIVAAKRVSEKMKLSRNVNYDRKVALLPILLGVAVAIAGAVVLVVLVGGAELLEVVR
ncbi:hypothetical protein [Natranaeroarchaeum aerophilus]|uniref:Uncharacterized protein n=1 Tax=Natranaeroarchaeum aerophilus TaxID=2917711 RepID=A0AAE3FTZ4_9EURY|nr:hypothetical protein [Natranaeroarchaeum aerophilus]MCL9815161.1 hypothetical protein [Natranaeroarchaeum aerophilus]